VPYFYFADDRGKILGIKQNKIIKEINYLESKAGCVRGGHYHKKTRESFYIIEGEIEIMLVNKKSKEKKVFIANGGDIINIEPGIIHTFKVLKRSRWVNMLSSAMDGPKKDIYKQ